MERIKYRPRAPVNVKVLAQICQRLPISIAAKNDQLGARQDAHMHEIVVQQTIREILVPFLPIPELVEVGITLHELRRPDAVGDSPHTDISIKYIDQIDASNPQYWALMEIKTLFAVDRLSDQKILDDIEKLVLCSKKYKTRCIFLLVGEKERIRKRKWDNSLIRPDANEFETPNYSARYELNDETVFIVPLSSSTDNKIEVYTWLISHEKATLEPSTSFDFLCAQRLTQRVQTG